MDESRLTAIAAALHDEQIGPLMPVTQTLNLERAGAEEPVRDGILANGPNGQ